MQAWTVSRARERQGETNNKPRRTGVRRAEPVDAVEGRAACGRQRVSPSDMESATDTESGQDTQISIASEGVCLCVDVFVAVGGTNGANGEGLELARTGLISQEGEREACEEREESQRERRMDRGPVKQGEPWLNGTDGA